MNLAETERECAAHAKAPRVSLKDIEGAIKWRFDLNASHAVGACCSHVAERDGSSIMEALGVLSVCILVTRNGFSIIGKSAPAAPENFHAELGKRLAYEDAIRQLWPLMGFALRDKLMSAPPSDADEEC